MGSTREHAWRADQSRRRCSIGITFTIHLARGAALNAPALTLYVDRQFVSPWAMSAYVTLVEKQLPFTLEAIDLESGEARRAPFRDMVLTARVPALVHGDFVLSESTAITEYLDQLFEAPAYSPALPQDVRDRARARQVQSWIRSDLQDLRNERSTMTVFYAPITTPLSPAAATAAEKLVRVASELVTGPNLFGDWCIADTDLALMLNRLILSGEAVPSRLREYAAGQWARGAVRQWLALERP
jgi:glutathione S-transferase